MRKLTEAQITARDDRKLRFRALVKELAELPEEERTRRFSALPFVKLSSGTAFSPSNAMLIAFQSGGKAVPTVLGGFAEWLKQGRAVRKGEHGYMVWVPIGAKKPTDESPELPQNSDDVHFIIGTVFDISQTEPKQENPDHE